MKTTGPLVQLVLLLVLVAGALRLAWELIEPALLPLSVLALLAAVALVVYRRR